MTPPPGGAHRKVSRADALIRRTLAAVAAVGAVGGFVLVLVLANGKPVPKEGPVVAAPRSSSAPVSLSPVPTTAPTTTPSRPPAAATTATQPPQGTSAAAAVARPPLTVLNNSTESGLAKRAAAQFARGGWRVAKVGNFTGRIAATTVYFDRGQEAAARALAAQFRAITRVLPRFAGLPGSGLTVVVTRDYPA